MILWVFLSKFLSPTKDSLVSFPIFLTACLLYLCQGFQHDVEKQNGSCCLELDFDGTTSNNSLLYITFPDNWSGYKVPKSLCIQDCKVCVLSRVQLFVTVWTVAHQTPLSMEFSFQPRGQTCVSLHWRWILYRWATGEAQIAMDCHQNVLDVIRWFFCVYWDDYGLSPLSH